MQRSIIPMLAAFACALAISACGGGPGSCSQMQSGGMACVEQSGPGVTPEVIRQYCASGMGSYSGATCTTENRVGRCTYVVATITTVTHFYPPVTLQQAEMTCSAIRNATFQAN